MATFPKSARLRRTPEFRRTFDQGHKMTCGPLVLYAAFRNPKTSESVDASKQPQGVRLGVVVSRKVGNAVIRNRVKRALRESFRALRSNLDSQEPWNHVDIIVLARPSASQCTQNDLRQSFESCLKRLSKTWGDSSPRTRNSREDSRHV